MDDRVPTPPDPAIFEANITALAAFLPKSAQDLREVMPPATVRAATGRDGRLTFAWTDEAGQIQWLGRTSMPSISAAALVDAFQPGNRNVLLAGLGQGAEAQLLLDRLAPYQAVMAVEENAWSAALCLRLYDFSADLRRRRLLLFVGPDAWEAMSVFLRTSVGYLVPERVLSWPWFEAKTIGEISDRLLELNREVTRSRTLQHKQGRQAREKGTAAPRSPSIALLSNAPAMPVQHLADRLTAAAESLARPCVRFTLDNPAMVHPFAIEEALLDAGPGLLIMLDAAPGSLQYELPPVPTVVLCSHRAVLANDWVRELPSAVKLGVPTATQREQLLALGLTESRVLLLPPAALPQLKHDSVHPCERILVLADGTDTSAEAAGLHLTSHCQLWEAATAFIRERCDTYCDDQAAEVVESAERKLKIRVDSEEVRAGLVDRVRRILGPVIVRESYCASLAEAGVDFDLCGDGWTSSTVLEPYHRGPRPTPRSVRRVLNGHGLVVSIEPSGCVRSVVLDGLAAGIAAVIRAHPLDYTGDGLSAVLDPDQHVRRFQSRSDLVRLAKRFVQGPTEFRRQAAAAAEHMNATHTWAHRLQAILHACEEG